MENKINHFNKTIVALLRNEVQEALQTIKEKYGLAELEIQNISFTQNSFSGKLFASLPEYQKLNEEYEIELVKLFAKQYALPTNMLNSTFVSNGKTHTITGVEPRNPKFPVITKCIDDGKSYKFTVQMIKEIFGRHNSQSSQKNSTLKLIHNSGK